MYIKTYTGNVYKVEDKGQKVYVVGDMDVIRFDQVKSEADNMEDLVDVWIVVDIGNNTSFELDSYKNIIERYYNKRARIYGMTYKMDLNSRLPKMYCICYDEDASGDLIFVEQNYFKAMQK